MTVTKKYPQKYKNTKQCKIGTKFMILNSLKIIL